MKKKLLGPFVIALLSFLNVSFGQAPNLGAASNFAVFTAVGALSNDGATNITGDIGTNEGAFTGFPPGTVNGQTHVADPTSAQAATDVKAAYSSLAATTCGLVIGTTLGNNQLLTPNVYCLGGASTLNGNLILDGQNNPDALFIFKIDGALFTNTSSTITLINGACRNNVYFQITGKVTLGTNSAFRGTILANEAISLLEGAYLEGRALSRAGAIDLHNNRVELIPPYLLTLTATPGACQTATNQYSVTGTVSMTNATASSLTITDGTATTTLAITAGQPSATYSLSGLSSGTGSHTVTATSSVTTCGTASTVFTTYTAPASCSVGVAISVSPGATQPGTNQYAITGTLSLTNAVAGIATITDGTVSTNVPINAGATSVPYSLGGLTSGTGNHTVTVSYAGQTASAPYIAPASLPVGVAISVSPGATQPGTNQYAITGTLSLTNAVAGTATITDGTVFTTVAITAGATSVPYSLGGLTSGTGSHTVTVSYAGQTASAPYVAPASLPVSASVLMLDKFVDKSRAKVGDLLTYTLVLTNSGNSSATNVTVRDSVSAGLTYVANSATAPTSTTYTPGSPTGTWNVASIGIGQSLTLTFRVTATSSGVLYNTATIPGDTASVCTSVPARVCAGELFTYRLTAAPGRSSYQWSRTVNGTTTILVGQTTNVLDVTAVGEYSLAVDNVTGKCPDFSCCPFVVEADSVASFSLVALAPTCQGPTSLTNGQITLTGLVSTTATAYTYQLVRGTTFAGGVLMTPAPLALPVGGLLSNSLGAGGYTVRVYTALGCSKDVVVLVPPAACQCPADACTPFVISQTKRGPRTDGR